MDSVRDAYEFRVRWEPFLLRSNVPDEGIIKDEKTRDPKSNPRFAMLIEAGAKVGLDFSNPNKIIPNTIPAHALLDFAKKKDGGSKQNEISELLFKAYFRDGKFLNESGVLSVAEQAGFSKDEIKAYIKDEKVLTNTQEQARNWARDGVTGVPYFYMNGQKTVSGAQEPDAFVKLFKIVAEKFPLKSSSGSART